ncbi:hypothetical protein NESM_000783900 [Novymonas esmeraldas]|uniref:Uncharacterized protein n=1 Tax=Novymonas esmeraldas TaxID=1808958 RepID=A0AAW0EWX7_9TRYP
MSHAVRDTAVFGVSAVGPSHDSHIGLHLHQSDVCDLHVETQGKWSGGSAEATPLQLSTDSVQLFARGDGSEPTEIVRGVVMDECDSSASGFQSRSGSFYASLMVAQQRRHQHHRHASELPLRLSPQSSRSGTTPSTASRDTESPLASHEDSQFSLSSSERDGTSLNPAQPPRTLQDLLAWRQDLLLARVNTQTPPLCTRCPGNTAASGAATQVCESQGEGHPLQQRPPTDSRTSPAVRVRAAVPTEQMDRDTVLRHLSENLSQHIAVPRRRREVADTSAMTEVERTRRAQQREALSDYIRLHDPALGQTVMNRILLVVVLLVMSYLLMELPFLLLG